jgi:hypothetical protein
VEDGTENAVVSLLQGGFRTITGIIGRKNKDNYLIRTATATIGIRGTDHEPMVILVPGPGQAAIAAPGTYDKVNVGIAYIRTDAGSVDIHRNQVGFAPVTRAAPVILPKIPPFYKPTPAPGPQKAKEEGRKDTAQGEAAPIRSTAVVDPASTTSAAPASASATTAPVVAITATDASGLSLNVTTQTQTTASGFTTAIGSTTIEPPPPPPPPPPPATSTPAVPIAGGTGKYWQQVYSPQAVGAGTYSSVYTLASGVPSNAQNFAFDASGNLVGMLSADYRLSDRGISTPPSYSNGALPYTGTPGGLPSSPLANVAVSFSGGTAPDGNYNDTVNGIRLGRYAGGTITTTDVSTSTSPLTYSTPLGNNSFIWAVREIPVSIPLTGSFAYTPVYATKPTDSLGNVGTLNNASLGANFTAQTVSPAVNITINNQNLYAAASNVPIDSQYGFNVSSSSDQNPGGGGVLRVTCYGSNCAPAPVGINTSTTPYLGYVYTGYGGRIQGGLAGASAADGAFFRYNFDTYYNPAVAAGSAGGVSTGDTRPVNDYIDGLVAFTKGASVASVAPATASSGSQFFRTAYLAQPPVAGDPLQSWTDAYGVSSTGYTNPFGAGSPNTIGNPSGSGKWETLSGGMVAEAATNATSYAATGISFGRYEGGTLTGVDAQGLSFARTIAGTYAWIKGPDVPFQTSALTGAARYKFDGGTQSGASFSGTVNSAYLAVNFNTAAVGVDLSVTGNGGAIWTATSSSSGALTGNPATNLRLGDNGFFFGSSWNAANPAMHESLYVTKNGSALSTPGISGQITGQLTGSNLSGAAMTYSFEDTSSAQGGGPQGAVAFALESFTSTPTPNNAAGSATLTPTTVTGTSAIDVNSVPYQMRIGAAGMIANAAATPPNAPASVDPSRFLTYVAAEAQNTGRLALGPDGLTTSWDSYRNITTTPTCSPTPCAPFVTQVPARASIDAASFVATGATPGSGQIALPAGKSPATVLESGFDPATGIRWGRYGGGVIAYFDRIGGTAPGILDVSTQNAHTIIGPTQTGQTALPVTGIYTYSNVGGTHPTDNLGNIGTLNAATLVADFSAQTVNTGVNLTMSGQTWAAGGSAVPISQAQFAANRDVSGGGNLNICVGSSCGATTLPTASSANTSGRIIGTFTGTSGQGAGMAYSLNQGGIAGITVSGVAAFKH